MKATLLRALALALASFGALAQTTGNNGIGGGSGGVSQLVAGANVTLSPTNGKGTVTVTASSTASTAYSALTSSTNSIANMVCGTGCSISTSGSGTNAATSVLGFLVTGGKTFTVDNSLTFTGTDGTTMTMPGISATLAGLGVAETWSALQTFTNSDIAILGSSTGTTTVTSANASATNYTITIPANTGTAAETNLAQTWGAVQTFGTNISIGGVTATGSTGTGANVFGTAPTISNPTFTGGGAFGTPASLVGTNISGTASALNIGGTAANLSGTPALPNGTTATTQTTGDNTTLLATDAFVIANAASAGVSSVAAGGGIAITGTGGGPYTGAVTVSANAPNRTVTSSPTVVTTDMGGQINSNVSGGGTLTIPAISSSIFPANSTLTVINYSASTEAVSTTPTIKAGGGCVSGTGIPAGATWNMISNGTTLDCNQTVSSSSGSGVTSVALTSPSFFTVGGSGCTTTCSLSLAYPTTQSAASWTTTGTLLAEPAATLTDTTSTGTVTTEVANGLGAPTIAASSTTTITNLANLYLAAPIAGTNVTATNLWALYTPGNVFTGPLNVNGTINNFNAGGINTQNVSLSGTHSPLGNGIYGDGTGVLGFSANSTGVGTWTTSLFNPLTPVQIGASGTAGSLAMGNATSGTVTLQPVTGALGTTTLNVPVAAGSGTLTQTIASGTAALGTSAISSATCATVVTVSASGVATTDTINSGFNGDPSGVTGYAPATAGSLYIYAYPTAGNVNFKVCNNTSSSITPGAVTLNWHVLR